MDIVQSASQALTHVLDQVKKWTFGDANSTGIPPLTLSSPPVGLAQFLPDEAQQEEAGKHETKVNRRLIVALVVVAFMGGLIGYIAAWLIDSKRYLRNQSRATKSESVNANTGQEEDIVFLTSVAEQRLPLMAVSVQEVNNNVIDRNESELSTQTSPAAVLTPQFNRKNKRRIKKRNGDSILLSFIKRQKYLILKFTQRLKQCSIYLSCIILIAIPQMILKKMLTVFKSKVPKKSKSRQSLAAKKIELRRASRTVKKSLPNLTTNPASVKIQSSPGSRILKFTAKIFHINKVHTILAWLKAKKAENKDPRRIYQKNLAKLSPSQFMLLNDKQLKIGSKRSKPIKPKYHGATTKTISRLMRWMILEFYGKLANYRRVYKLDDCRERKNVQKLARQEKERTRYAFSELSPFDIIKLELRPRTSSQVSDPQKMSIGGLLDFLQLVCFSRRVVEPVKTIEQRRNIYNLPIDDAPLWSIRNLFSDEPKNEDLVNTAKRLDLSNLSLAEVITHEFGREHHDKKINVEESEEEEVCTNGSCKRFDLWKIYMRLLGRTSNKKDEGLREVINRFYSKLKTQMKSSESTAITSTGGNDKTKTVSTESAPEAFAIPDYEVINEEEKADLNTDEYCDVKVRKIQTRGKKRPCPKPNSQVRKIKSARMEPVPIAPKSGSDPYTFDRFLITGPLRPRRR